MARHVLSAFLWLTLGASAGLAQTTAFTYQGQLTDAGQPANANFDLQFALFGNASGGTQIGTTQTVATVPVSGGVFTVQLDFGVSAFPGANRFLEIGVRPAGGGTYTTLAPRQQISSTPYAIRTLSAATADALSSACVGCVQDTQIQAVAGSKVSGTIPAASVPAGSSSYVQNTTTQQANSNFNISGNGTIGGDLTVAGTLNANVSGNFIQNRTTQQTTANFNISGNGTLGGTLAANKIGVGTASPTSQVEIAAQDGLKITGVQPFLTLKDTNAGGARGVLASGNGDLSLYPNSFIGGTAALTVKNSSGNLGVGTTSPTSKVEIAAQDGLKITGFEPFLTLKDTNAGGASGVLASGNGDLSLYPDSFIGAPGAALTLKNGSGNLGIGTVNPAQKLHIAAPEARLQLQSTASDTFTTIQYVTDAQEWDTGVGGSGVSNGVANKFYIFDGTAGQFRMAIDTNGNVGIGTTSPTAAKLQVNDSASGTAVYGTTSTSGSGVFGESTGSAGYGVYGSSSSGYALYANGNTGQAAGAHGWVRAMLRVTNSGQIYRCYNSSLAGSAASTPPCGFAVNHFTAGGYGITLGFPVADYFYSITPGSGQFFGGGINAGAYYEAASSPTSLNVRTFRANGDDQTTTDDEFMLILF